MIQHHPEANRLGVIDGLTSMPEPGGQAVAAVMRNLEEGRADR